MIRTRVLSSALLFCLWGCAPSGGDNDGAQSDGKVKEAVRDVITQDFKTYEGAKERLESIDRQSKGRVEQEAR